MEFKPFSPKQINAMTMDKFINILEGSVRSGKTISSIIGWVNFVTNAEGNEFLMSGKTTDSLYRNVISDLIGIYGKKRVRYYKSSQGGAKLIFKAHKGGKTIDKVCYCFGGGKSDSFESIRGMTIQGWYCDEVTLHHETFVKEALNRMSMDGAKALWTTNPDSPYHYIKTEYIDKAEENDYKTIHFTIDDNYALSEEYKRNIKKAYSGVYYNRAILGQWVLAEGVIYSMFDEERHVFSELPTDIRRYWIGIDQGFTNATVFYLCGLGQDGKLYVMDEYYHSGKNSQRQKSPSDYAKDLQAWIVKHEQAGRRIERVIIDPAAKGFITQCHQIGIRNINKADNDVKAGIEFVASLMSLDYFRVHSSCKELIKGFSTYVWDEKAQERGEDKPLKQDDDCVDGLRYAVFTMRNYFRHVFKNIA